MGRPKKVEISLREKIQRIREAGIKPLDSNAEDTADQMPELSERLQQILQISTNRKHPGQMLFLVMYDIEDNKVRTQIAKYLIQKGLTRIQKSIYMAELDHKTFREIHQTLKEVNEVYDNADSIFLIPISSDEVKSMKVIGRSVDFDLIAGNKNTLFF